MDRNLLIEEILAVYQKHGWKLQRVLMRPETRRGLVRDLDMNFEGMRIDEGPVDALWFSRRSHNNREAWELRLLSETPYALFETFEADAPEGLREETRKTLEARLHEYVSRG